MTPKARATKSAHANHHATSETNEEVTMSTKNQDTTSTATITPVAAPAATPPSQADPKPAPTLFVAPPPASANIPTVPQNFTPAEPGQFRTTSPRTAELVALPQAVADLKGFTDYAQVIGGSAPTLAEVTNAFELASQWSTMRASSSKWDEFCVVQEGLAWQSLRGVTGRLAPAYALSVTADPTLKSKYTGLTLLLNAKKAIAQKGVYTRRLNVLDKAQGKPPSHGRAGKTAQRKAANAALAEKQAAAQAAASAGATSSAASPATAAAVTDTPAAATTPKPVTVTPVTAPGATIANGATPS